MSNTVHPTKNRRLRLTAVGLVLVACGFGCASADGDVADRETSETSEDLLFRLCGGFFGSTCRFDQVCVPLFSDACPSSTTVGLCAPRPFFCLPVTDPVCGCNGVTYASRCEAARAGTATAHDGACEVTPGAPLCDASECGGAAVCVDDPDDDCDLDDGEDCPGVCDCSVIEPCPRGQVWDDDPSVCACTAEETDPCARIICPDGTECVPQDDGSILCL